MVNLLDFEHKKASKCKRIKMQIHQNAKASKCKSIKMQKHQNAKA